MDWQNERYVRKYVRETVDDALLPWESRAIWNELLGKFDRAGVIDVGKHGWRGVAALIRMPPEVVEEFGPALLDDGRIEMRGKYLIAPNFVEAQEANQSDKLRKAESRARRRDRARAEELGLMTESEPVTESDEVSQNVTDGHESGQSVTRGHEESHAVTPCYAVPSLAVPSRALCPDETGSSERPPRDRRRVKVMEVSALFEPGLSRDVIERFVAARASGSERGVVDRFAAELSELEKTNVDAFAYGVRTVLEHDSFDFSGAPTRIVNFVRKCMDTYARRGSSAPRRTRGAPNPNDLSPADLAALAKDMESRGL